MRKMFVLPLLIILLGACETDWFTGSKSDSEKDILYSYLESGIDSHEERFILLDQIIHLERETGNVHTLNRYLSSYLMDYSEDPFRSYYWIILARNYEEMGQSDMADLYYQRILHEEYDLKIMGNSLRFYSLSKLIERESDPRLKTLYLKERITEFPDQIDLGYNYYLLGEAYEEQGEWIQAIQAYIDYLRYPETDIPGAPANIRYRIQQKINFHYSDKSWTAADIDALIGTLQWAAQTQNIALLNRYKSEIGFFAMSWTQEETDQDAHVDFDFAPFMTNRVRFGSKDPMSTDTEVYVKTTGWSYMINTWYLYFRKIDYPANPEINGRWEWAGVYLDEKIGSQM